MGAVTKTSKTPRSMAKTTPARQVFTSASKKKPAPNASILSFFKKTPAPEETLFVGNEVSAAAFVAEEDLNDVDDPTAERFNEVDVPVKRRKLSCDDREKDAPAHAVVKEEDPVKDPRAKSPTSQPARKPTKKGPFLDDDDSDDDSDDSHHTDHDNRPAKRKIESPKRIPETDQESKALQPKESLLPVSPSATHNQNTDLIQEEQEHDDFGDNPEGPEWGDIDDADEAGEEGLERRYMEYQARIEAQEFETAITNSSDEVSGPTDGAECCPICFSSLAGVTAEQASVHVNSCLDGKPTPLPNQPKSNIPAPKTTKNSPPSEQNKVVESSKMSRRFARAAIARPGQANPITLDAPATSASIGNTSAFSKLMSGHAENNAWAAAAAAEQSSRGRQAYERTCPFYKIMPGLSICVDAFRYGAVQGCNAYFLSHFHSDHYIGLTANWTHGPIYCSKVTGSLIKSQLRTAAKYVVELEFEERFVVPGTEGVVVTMIPANHCPGSSLFLFEKTLGKGSSARAQRILHCGDFRACPAHIAHPQLMPEVIDSISGKIKKQKIDICYLDTTYLNPRYSFPPQEVVIRSCAELCAALHRGLQEKDESVWTKILRRREGVSDNDVSRFFINSDGSGQSPTKKGSSSACNNHPSALTALNPKSRLLVVCGTYSIGKERICKAIAQALRTKIFASAHKIRIIAQLGDPELTALMTSNPAEAQVHMQMLSEIRPETLSDYLATYRAHFGRIVGFRPSGWNYRPAGTAANANASPSSVAMTTLLHGGNWRPQYASKDLVPQRGSTNEAMCFGVPYSEHSSFRELAMFIMSLHIEKVVPTVNVGSEVGRKRMKGWTDRWLAERRRGGLTRLIQDGEGEEGQAAEQNSRTLWDGKSNQGGDLRW
ncbi:DNA cross-link repair protein SNM1 [Pyricularia oryzae 70-15]|uniref:DNA cross-link repair protein SNM1 n=1 Tax=Pyricularia oryzae (strain 70-15 / ATCC MYA-4617 / FGSC 8958) TaxID=242507 RepID=G4NCP8_PYRO7|nr:DNA cross-link repair protein SNM1 [Pyricularia oryzae 70-15]EHA49142.1 DNA cross-link repair protein SNM1 [Pyricularia oryzae 70-15]